MNLPPNCLSARGLHYIGQYLTQPGLAGRDGTIAYRKTAFHPQFARHIAEKKVRIQTDARNLRCSKTIKMDKKTSFFYSSGSYSASTATSGSFAVEILKYDWN